MPRRQYPVKSNERFKQYDALVDCVWPFLEGPQKHSQITATGIAWKLYNTKKRGFYLSANHLSEKGSMSIASAKRVMKSLQEQKIFRLVSQGGLSKGGRGVANFYELGLVHPNADDDARKRYEEIKGSIQKGITGDTV